MPIREPRWWYGRQWQALASALDPLGRLYGQAIERRMTGTTPYRSRLPVLCVGNLVAGGTGKTPLALHIAQLLRMRGATPAFLSRGYGGRIAGPHRVDPLTDTALDVGDEPLVLAQMAPTIVARDRAAGARLIEDIGATHILMDDGLLNPSLHKDLALAVVDGERWVGNGRLIPAGPLRAALTFQARHVDALVISGQSSGAAGLPEVLSRHFDVPIVSVSRVFAEDVSWLREKSWIAYAGIGHPEAFFAMLERHGAQLLAREAFPDHHAFATSDAVRLLALARSSGAGLVTTQKDRVRLAGGGDALRRLAAQSRHIGLRLEMTPDDARRIGDLLAGLPSIDRT